MNLLLQVQRGGFLAALPLIFAILALLLFLLAAVPKPPSPVEPHRVRLIAAGLASAAVAWVIGLFGGM